jgi:hypothetical protein
VSLKNRKIDETSIREIVESGVYYVSHINEHDKSCYGVFIFLSK